MLNRTSPTPNHAFTALLSCVLLLTASLALSCGDDDGAGTPPPGNAMVGDNNASTNNGTNNGSNNGSNNGANNGSNNGANNANNTGENNTGVNNTGVNNTGENNTGENNTAMNNNQQTNNNAGMNNTGNNTPMGECNPFTSEDCEETEQCRPIAGVPRCTPRSPDQLGDGEVCIGGDCGVGFNCINWGDARGQVCTRMCDRSPDAVCPEGQECSAFTSENQSIGLCQPIPAMCDIYAQDCPEAGQACTFGRDTEEMPIFICAAEGEVEEGGACGSGNGRCRAGKVCINNGDMTSTCHQVCEQDTHCTLEGETCAGVSNTWNVTFCAVVTGG